MQNHAEESRIPAALQRQRRWRSHRHCCSSVSAPGFTTVCSPPPPLHSLFKPGWGGRCCSASWAVSYMWYWTVQPHCYGRHPLYSVLSGWSSMNAHCCSSTLSRFCQTGWISGGGGLCRNVCWCWCVFIDQSQWIVNLLFHVSKSSHCWNCSFYSEPKRDSLLLSPCRFRLFSFLSFSTFTLKPCSFALTILSFAARQSQRQEVLWLLAKQLHVHRIMSLLYVT